MVISEILDEMKKMQKEDLIPTTIICDNKTFHDIQKDDSYIFGGPYVQTPEYSKIFGLDIKIDDRIIRFKIVDKRMIHINKEIVQNEFDEWEKIVDDKPKYKYRNSFISGTSIFIGGSNVTMVVVGSGLSI